jgi:hypothetical protein
MYCLVMQARVTLFLCAVSIGLGCGDQGRAAKTTARPLDERVGPEVPEDLGKSEGRGVDAPVVVVTIDGVRWKEVFEGTDPTRSTHPVVPASQLAPNLHTLGVDRGAFVGAPGRGSIAATGPNYISLPGYTEILLGRPSVVCQRNDCPRTTLPTILDEARTTGAKVAAFASWSPLDLAVTASPGGFVVSCGQDELKDDPFPGVGDYRPDRLTADAALHYFEKEAPDVLFLGLGDPDEHAHRNDYEAYIASIRHADDVLGRLIKIIDRQGERGKRTHIIVTADHGREAGFRHHGASAEAARVWLVAAGPRFQARGAITTKDPRHLADIAPTLRTVLGMPPDTSEAAGSPIDELFVGAAGTLTPSSRSGS